MNLKDEKFLAGLKTAIESGVETDWAFDGEDEVPYDTFDSDVALSAVMKLLEEESNIYMKIDPDVALEKVNELSEKRDQKIRELFSGVNKPETTTCESCLKEVPLEWALLTVGEHANSHCYKCYSEMVSDYIRIWIPIEEFELETNTYYDIFTKDKTVISRVHFERQWFNVSFDSIIKAWNIIELKNVTHIMKHPADPEI